MHAATRNCRGFRCEDYTSFRCLRNHANLNHEYNTARFHKFPRRFFFFLPKAITLSLHSLRIHRATRCTDRRLQLGVHARVQRLARFAKAPGGGVYFSGKNLLLSPAVLQFHELSRAWIFSVDVRYTVDSFKIERRRSKTRGKIKDLDDGRRGTTRS